MELYREPTLQVARLGTRDQSWRQAGAGEESPLLLLHGIGTNSRAWAGQFAGLSGDRPVIAWDAPGYGESSALDADWPTPEDYAEAALALLDYLEVDRCVVIGQSLGAVMATALARHCPERVVALMLASPASGYGRARGETLPQKIAQRLTDLESLGPVAFAERRSAALLTPHALPAAHAIVRSAMAELTARGYRQAARLLATADLAQAVHGLTLPRLVMWGALDTITPPDSCRRIAAAADCEGIELAELGHAFATEAPARFNAGILSWIRTLEHQPTWT